MNITYLSRAIKNIDFKRELGITQNLHATLQVKSNNRVDFDVENKRLVCTMEIAISEKTKEPRLSAFIEMVGLFKCDEDITEDNRGQLHLLACQKLYPYIVEAFASISVTAGIAPIILPPLNLNINEIEDDKR